jgi:hypothetical protein
MGGQPVQVEKASVTMSPQHCKALIHSLTETLAGYEQVFGKLQLPEEYTKSLRNADQVAQLLLRMTEETRRQRAQQLEMAIPAPSSTAKKRPSKRSRGGAQQ